jgi:hypothetical protein
MIYSKLNVSKNLLRLKLKYKLLKMKPERLRKHLKMLKRKD